MRSWLAAALILGSCSKPSSAPPASPSANPTGASEVPTHPDAHVGHLRLIPAPDYPDAAVVIADQLAQSQEVHRRLLVYEGASWCDPCRRFHAAAEKGELDAQFPDLDLLVFDVDKDTERLRAAGYLSKYIPLFVIPTKEGFSTARQVEGGLEGDRAVGQLVPRLMALLNQPG